jgi:hypothetical protein
MKLLLLAVIISISLSSCAFKIGADGSSESVIDGASLIQAMKIISEK